MGVASYLRRILGGGKLITESESKEIEKDLWYVFKLLKYEEKSLVDIENDELHHIILVLEGSGLYRADFIDLLLELFQLLKRREEGDVTAQALIEQKTIEIQIILNSAEAYVQKMLEKINKILVNEEVFKKKAVAALSKEYHSYDPKDLQKFISASDSLIRIMKSMHKTLIQLLYWLGKTKKVTGNLRTFESEVAKLKSKGQAINAYIRLTNNLTKKMNDFKDKVLSEEQSLRSEVLKDEEVFRLQKELFQKLFAAEIKLLERVQ